jgi:hypothetical protein
MEAKNLQVEGRGVGRGNRGVQGGGGVGVAVAVAVAVGSCKQLRERHGIKSKLSLALRQ